MAAPVVRLRALTVLVWSEAWSAKGEEGKICCYFEDTPIVARVPTV